METLGYMGMFFVGGILGFIGGGGALLTVPILVSIFKIPVLVATSYSLLIVGVSSLFGAWGYRGSVDYKTAVMFFVPSALGTYLSRQVLTPWIPPVLYQFETTAFTKEKLILGVFALVMFGASFAMIRPQPQTPRSGTHGGRVFFLLSLGLGVGLLAGFVGAGGGFLIIPALVLIAHKPMAQAVGTSLLIITINSLVGFCGDLLAGAAFDWIFLFQVTGLAVLGIFAGSHGAGYVSPSKVKPAFGWFVFSVGCWVMYSSLT
jgi:uncharacterized membrane protein YfcA